MIIFYVSLRKIFTMPTVIIDKSFLLKDGKTVAQCEGRSFLENELIHKLLFYTECPQHTKKEISIIRFYRCMWKKKKLKAHLIETLLKDCGFEKVKEAEWKLKSDNDGK